MNVQQMEARQRVISSQARGIHRRITEDMPEAEARKLEREFETLMLEYDELKLAIEERRENDIGDPRRPHGPDAEALGVDDRQGQGQPESAGRILIDSGEARDKFQVAARAKRQDEYRGLTLGRYFRAMTTGAKTDTERRALSEGSDSAGGYTVPEYLGGALIDALRAQSVCVRAGAQTMPLSTSINNVAKLNADPTPAWRQELGSVAESDPTFGNVALNPQSLAVKCSVSHELLEDSLNLERELPRVMSAAMAVELDRVALLGSGTAPEPRGVANVSGIGTNALAGALTSYAPFVTARTGILSANAGPVSAFILHPRDEGTLTGLTDSDGQPLNAPRAVSEIPMLTTTAIPTDGGAGSDESTIFAGNFRHLIIGIRQDVRIEVLRHTLASDLSYTFVAHMRADVAVQHAAAFYTQTGVQG
ncbi:phage major capsid protein [Mameliella alba]|nr:phage major capsid protein [Mameliella alba]MBY6171517.1 phage major capsid protein [Mameliella alba]MBY6176741.1 phage major capsid protein [Mameliella alba]